MMAAWALWFFLGFFISKVSLHCTYFKGSFPLFQYTKPILSLQARLQAFHTKTSRKQPNGAYILLFFQGPRLLGRVPKYQLTF